MNELLKKYNEYIKLKNCRAEYSLANGATLSVTYKGKNFVHLLGLHKLTDIQLIQLLNDRNNQKVHHQPNKKSKFTDAMVKSSVFYKDIADRYENLTPLTYTDAIINFSPSTKISIGLTYTKLPGLLIIDLWITLSSALSIQSIYEFLYPEHSLHNIILRCRKRYPYIVSTVFFNPHAHHRNDCRISLLQKFFCKLCSSKPGR